MSRGRSRVFADSHELRRPVLAGVSLRLAALVLSLLSAPLAVSAQDRGAELEDLRERIQDSREKVTTHEADERALLEQLEDVDRRLRDAVRNRDEGRRVVAKAKRYVDAFRPALDRAQAELSKTQQALSSRAVALYCGGELGVIRVLFSSQTLPEMLSRASALRILVRHDAKLVTRFGEERDRLATLRTDAETALRDHEKADRKLVKLAAALSLERSSKGGILRGVRENRTSERQLLLELEQAAQALEETIRTLGERAGSGSVSAGFRERRGELSPPVSAEISEPFGKVVDPEFMTTTFRSGVDFAAKAGTTVRGVGQGVVRFAGWFRGYGRIVIVDHGDGFHTISGHLDEIHVKVGVLVDEGESLGTVGETGSLGGPSLYFELRDNGDPVDPIPWLMDPRA